MLTALIVAVLTQAPLEGSSQLYVEVTPLAERMPLPARATLVAPTPDTGWTTGARISATLLGAALGAAPSVALAVSMPQLCAGEEMCGFFGQIGSIVLIPVATAMGAYLVHSGVGGQGHILFAAVGAMAAATASILIGVAAWQSVALRQPDAGYYVVGIGGAVVALATTLSLELGHQLKMSRDTEAASVAVLPVNGGAVVSASGAF